jgi:DNA-binding XRE family transcriptional regulator
MIFSLVFGQRWSLNKPLQIHQHRLPNIEIETLRLKQLRERWGISQQELAKILNVSQPAVSKLEDRPDVMLSTLRQYVESLGGNLEILATFPDRPAVRLEIAETGEPSPVAHVA